MRNPDPLDPKRPRTRAPVEHNGTTNECEARRRNEPALNLGKTDNDDESVFRSRFVGALPSEWQDLATPLATHAWLVAERNAHVNLTRVTDPVAMARRHAVDSLAGVEEIRKLGKRRIVDLGTGAGWPGLALSLALPDHSFILMDGTRKKIDVVREIAATLQLGDRVDCRWARIEQIDRSELEDCVLVARAVGPIERILGWLPKLKRISIVLWKGPALEEELTNAASVMSKRRIRLIRRVSYRIPEDPAQRELAVLERTSSTKKHRHGQ